MQIIVMAFICFATIKAEIIQRDFSLIRRYAKSEVALINCVANNQIEDAEKLIEDGVDINAQDKNGETALLKAVTIQNVAMAQVLLEKGADPNIHGIAPYYRSGDAPLVLAIKESNVEIVKLLLEYGASADTCFFPPLFFASGIMDHMYYGASNYKATVCYERYMDYEKLFNKISNLVCKNKEILELLIDSGSDLGVLEGLVLERGFESTSNKYQDVLEGTPLMFSILYKDRVLSYVFSMIDYLYKSKKVFDLQKIINFTNQIKLALNQKIEIFAKHCSDINVQNSSGKSVWHVAADVLDIEAIKTIICNGADIETKLSSDDRTLLIALSGKKDLKEEELELAQFLIDRGAYARIDYRDERVVFDDIIDDQVRSLVFSRYENGRQDERKNPSLYEINVTITKENIGRYIDRYSTNSYDVKNDDCDNTCPDCVCVENNDDYDHDDEFICNCQECKQKKGCKQEQGCVQKNSKHLVDAPLPQDSLFKKFKKLCCLSLYWMRDSVKKIKTMLWSSKISRKTVEQANLEYIHLCMLFIEEPQKGAKEFEIWKEKYSVLLEAVHKEWCKGDGKYQDKHFSEFIKERFLDDKGGSIFGILGDYYLKMYKHELIKEARANNN